MFPGLEIRSFTRPPLEVDRAIIKVSVCYVIPQIQVLRSIEDHTGKVSKLERVVKANSTTACICRKVET